MEGMIGEIRATAESIFLGGDWIYLGMVGVALIAGVLATRNIAQVLCGSLLAMLVLALVWVGYGGATSETPTDPATWIGQVENGWANVSASSGGTLVSYLIVFAIVIGVLSLARSLVFRG